jgi:hypothetical protein
MTEATGKPPTVRPGFLKWSAVAFVVLLPFVVHSIWDYYEERQLAEAIQEIERRGEPTKLADPHLDRESFESERDYRAAAVLASGFLLDTQASLKMVVAASQVGEWPSDIGPLRSAVRIYENSLVLADRAASLPFRGFRIGTTYPARTSDLMSVQRLSGYRAIVLAADGNSDGAVRSLTTEVRLGEPLQRYAYSTLRVADAVHVLERTRASAAELARLGAAFDDLDDDRILAAWFQELRRTVLTSQRGSEGAGADVWSYGRPRLAERALATVTLFKGPWTTHILNEQLRIFAELIDAASAPWPDRIDRTRMIDTEEIFPSNVPGAGAIRKAQTSVEGLVLAFVHQIAAFRSLRTAVAVE